MHFRAYQTGDLDALYALDIVCFAETFRFSRRLLKMLAEAGDARTIVAEEDGAIAGFVIVQMERWDTERVAYIMTLDVAPDHRRRGLASQLMQRAEEAAREAGVDSLALHVWVENEGALRFYERMGYMRAGRVARFYNDAGDAWIYRKPLLRS